MSMSNNENSTTPANVVESSHESKIGIITINRPRQFNALNTEVLNAINSVLDKWESRDAVQAVIFTGAGDKAFAAGADIKELSQLSPWQVVNEYPMAELYKRIESYPKPTVAAVNGLALGGGFELALSCDIRIADPQSRFAFPELGLGIIPGAGGTQRLREVAGKAIALDLILTRKELDAEAALQWGVITRISDDPVATAMEICHVLNENGPLAQRVARKSIKAGVLGGHQQEQLSQGMAFSHSDRAEGLSAFLDKRAPNFNSSVSISTEKEESHAPTK